MLDQMSQMARKMLVERARQQHPQPSPQNTHADPAPPPPYEAAIDSDTDSESSDDDDNDTFPQSPLKLTINAANSIHGNNNLVPLSASQQHVANATKFSALLLGVVELINRANAKKTPRRGGGGGLNVEITVNCGITVVGDRNVIGNVGLKPKMSAAAGTVGSEGNGVGDAGVGVVAGAKRKGDEESEDERPMKKVDVEGIDPEGL